MAARAWLLAAAWCLACAAPAALAEEFPNFYQGTVFTSSTTPTEDEVAQALDQVMLRLTGDPKIDEHPLLGELFARPGRLMSEFVRVPGSSEQKPHLRIGFAPRLLRDYLSAAGVPFWGEDRPRILVARLLRDGVRSSALTLREEDDRKLGLREMLQRVSLDRGILWQLPNGDLQDVEQMRAIADGAGGPGGAGAGGGLRRLLDRYGAQGLLLAVEERMGAQSSSVSWRLYSDLRGTLPEAPDIGAFEGVLREVASVFSERAVRRAGRLEEILLVVEQVGGFASAYDVRGALIKALGESSVRLHAMHGDRLEFVIVSDRGLLSLRRALTGQVGLTPVQRPPNPGGLLEIYYAMDSL